MKQLLVLGGGTAGTMAANKLRARLSTDEWAVTVVDPRQEHHYQAGYLFIPFGGYTREQVVRPLADLLVVGVILVRAEVDRVDAEAERGHPRRRPRHDL